MIRAGSLRDKISVYPMAPAKSGTDYERYGDETPTRGAAVELLAHVEPVSATESLSGADVRTTDLLAITQPSAALTGTSEVVYQGASYQVTGDPKIFNHLSGQSHAEVFLRRIEG